jgi:magnesium chelatase family protein
MNYFKVSCVGVIGKKVSVIDVECVQQRRLPYLHVIGGSSGNASPIRERVLAAIESSGYRLPARRFTVSLGGGGPLPAEELDLAVALALLGSSKVFPRARLGKFAVSGALSLDGRLLPLACRAPLRSLGEEKMDLGLLLPWEDSHILGAKRAGGGFHSLAEVVEFLRGEEVSGPRKHSTDDLEGEDRKSWSWLQGRPLAQRLLPVCAAGAHPMLCFGESARRIAEDLLALLPPLGAAAREEAESLQRLAGEAAWRRPLREMRADQASRLLRFDAKTGIFGEISLAHGGLLFVSSLGERPLALMRLLQEPLESGAIRAFRAGHAVQMPADWQLLAQADLCPCGANGACGCATHEVQKWRQRLDQVRAFFPLMYQAEEAGAGESLSLAELRKRVAAARSLALQRQSVPNNRLGLEDCLKAKPWSAEAREVWRISRGSRSELALGRVALTISDLRAGGSVEKNDLLEARHYVPEPFVPRSRSGSSLWSASAPSTRSSAMP